MKKQSFKEYLKDLGSSLKTDLKKFWGYVKAQKRETLGISILKEGNKLCSTDREKAEALNRHFSSVFTRNDGSSTPDKGPSPHPSIDDLTIYAHGILKQLKELKVNTSSGPDELPARMLHDYA